MTAINLFGKGHGILNLDLNRQPDGCDSELGFQFGDNFLEKQTEIDQSVYSEIRTTENNPDGSLRKRRRFSSGEKGKAKVDDCVPLIVIEDSEDNLSLELGQNPVGKESEKINSNNIWPQIEVESSLKNMGPVVEHNFFEAEASDSESEQENVKAVEFLLDLREEVRKREEREKYHEIARYHAPRLARSIPDEEFYRRKYHPEETNVVVKEAEDEFQDLDSPFCVAMIMIKKRNSSSSGQKKSPDGGLKWVPSKVSGRGVVKRGVPPLLELSLNVLAKNSEAMVSLEHVPDFLRHKLSRMICDKGKMDASFVELLARGSPTEIRVKNCAKLEEDDFTKILGSCNTQHVTVLQLDLSGQSLPDNVLRNNLARSSCSLPALATVSLRGALRLTDIGLTALVESASALQSVNLSHCSLLTSSGIAALVSCLEYTLRELYIDHCQDIDATVMLPALKRLKYLEVLSVASIESVCDDFVIEIVKACGTNMKELVFAECVELTDIAFKAVGKNCSRLCALDLSNLHKLTNSTLQYLADGCQSIRSLKLYRNSFSDEAIAAFLEVTGDSLSELSLNHIKEVGLNTALSLGKCSRNLQSLDLSWCRRLRDEALGFIVDSCSSLRLLKLFGCTQITDLFLNGHSNSKVQIIGLGLKPLLEHLDDLEPQKGPLRYSPSTSL
ncbi:hypothetical protein Pint_13672 [Pistacia integerrima]|uniref:Uncharacterized protein n=1 Tax=Pistacia integerrima TaxID=434235 RepID=A0ACC0Y5G0_9ROSI|nr:hypothetical protein Pint_13672 [Pistacia integerrima]